MFHFVVPANAGTHDFLFICIMFEVVDTRVKPAHDGG